MSEGAKFDTTLDGSIPPYIDRGRGVLVEGGDLSSFCVPNQEKITSIEIVNLKNRYNASVVGPKVSFELPIKISRVDALSDIDRVVRGVYGTPAINRDLLTEWNNRNEFNSRKKIPCALVVTCCVPDTSHMTKDQQDRDGLNNVHIGDLAIAIALGFAVGGRDPSSGRVVRASGDDTRYLQFSSNGIAISPPFNWADGVPMFASFQESSDETPPGSPIKPRRRANN